MMNKIKHAIISLVVGCLLGSALAASETDAKPSPVIGLGIVVADATLAAEQYNKLLGITEWRIIDLNTQDGAVRLAAGRFKGKTIELLQPLYGKSLVADFLAKHGPGLFHLELAKNHQLQDLDKAETAIAESDHWPAQPTPYLVSWFASYQPLGIYIKQASRSYYPQDFWGVKTLPAQTIPLSNSFVQQLGIVVDNALATAKQWQKIVGLKPWVFVDFKPPMTSNGQYRGAMGSGYSHVHVGYGQLFDLQIELLQPMAGPTPHRDYLRGSGAGAQHISLGRLSSHDALSEHYQSQGIAVQMQSDNGGAGRTATYMSSEKELGMVLEFTRAFKGIGTLKIVNAIGMPVKKSALSKTGKP